MFDELDVSQVTAGSCYKVIPEMVDEMWCIDELKEMGGLIDNHPLMGELHSSSDDRTTEQISEEWDGCFQVKRRKNTKKNPSRSRFTDSWIMGN